MDVEQVRRQKELVSIVLPDLRGGGVERVRILLAQEFLRRGLAVEFVLLRAEGELILEAANTASIVNLNSSRLRSAFVPLVKYLARRRPAAVLAAMWPLTGLVALARFMARCDSRLIVSEHNALSHTPAYRGWSGRIHAAIGKYLYEMADGVVCVSKGVCSDLVASTGVDSRLLTVIYNPVRRIDERTKVDHHIAAWWRSGEGKLLAIGSLKTQKDYPTLLRAVADIKATKDVRLVILGEGPQRPALVALIKMLCIENHVRMPGFVSNPYAYLAEADLLVLSSAWEGLGNVIIEALVAGVPVVSTDCPSGPAEILEDGRFGWMVPVGNPQALALAVKQALISTVDRTLLQSRGGEFSIEKAADQYIRLLLP